MKGRNKPLELELELDEDKGKKNFTKYKVNFVGGRDLMDRASASYPHGVKGLGFKPPWRQKLYHCNLYLLLK